MGERIHTSVGAGSTTRKKWTLVIAGTAVAILGAGVLLQVTRPTSAFPEDRGAAQPGRASTGSAPQQGVKKVVKVGNEFITYDELAAECVQRVGEEILENLINRKIIQQACAAQGIEVSEAEVNEELLRISKKFGLAQDEYLKLLQAERNVTPAQYRRDILWTSLALKKLAGEEVEITKDDLQKAFVRNFGPRVKARAIILDNSRRATEVWQKVNKNPELFGKLAREHSVDPSSRALDGVVPPIPRYSGSPELEKAAFKLKEGEISAVIQVDLNQFIILMCEGRTEPTVQDASEVEDILRDELREQKIQQSVAKVFMKLKEEARVDNYLKGESTGGERRAAGSKQAGKPGAIRQTGATGGGKGAARQIPDEALGEAPAQPARSAQTPGRAKTR